MLVKILQFIIGILILFSCRQQVRQLTINSPDPIFFTSTDENSIVWCAGGKDPSLSTRIYEQKAGENKAVLLYETNDNQYQLMPVRKSGKNLIWVESQQLGYRNIIWELCLIDLDNPGKRRIIATNKDRPAVQAPIFSVYQDQIVYDFFIPNGNDDYDSPLYIYSITANKSQQFIQLPHYDLLSPVMDKNQIVCCRLSLGRDDEIVSELIRFDLTTNQLTELNLSKRAFQPDINGDWLIYKEAPTLYAYGNIMLYNQVSKKLIRLNQNSEGERPYIGNQYATWESADFDQIEVIELATNKRLLLEKGLSGKPFLTGNAITWVSEPEQGKAVIRYQKF